MKTNFHKKSFAFKTRFEEEADMNSEMAYSSLIKMLTCESTKMTRMWCNLHQIFGPINVGLHKKNNSLL